MSNNPQAVNNAAAEWFAAMQDDAVGESIWPAFDAWLAADPARRQAYAELEHMWRGLDGLAPEIQARDADCSSNRAARFHAFQRPRYRWAAAVAAMLMVFVVSSACLLIPSSVQTDYQTARTEKNLTLQDGSRLTLAPDSRLSVAMSDDARRIYLHRGSAVFSVSADRQRPFDVIAANGRIRVVGTIFQVRIDERVHVGVHQGSVDVLVDGAAQPTRLTRGYGAIYDDRGLTRISQQDAQQPAISASLTDQRMALLTSGVRLAGAAPVAEPDLTGNESLPSRQLTMRYRRGRHHAATDTIPRQTRSLG